MAYVYPTTAIELELSGWRLGIVGASELGTTTKLAGGGWADVTTDLLEDPIVLDYGFHSDHPSDRVAPPGTLTFGLRNDANNSGNQLGYYSPNHASKRLGFDFGIRARLKQTYSGVTYYWMGTLSQIVVEPGQYEGRRVTCVAVDWMDVPMRNTAPTALQVNKRSDQVFSAVLANLATQPTATTVRIGNETFAYALDNVPSNVKALGTFSDVARSELGYIFAVRDQTAGQTVVNENRRYRSSVTALLVTLDNTMHMLEVPGDRGDVLNHFLLTVYPRRVDSGQTTVVAKIDVADATAILVGQTQTVFIDYTDPVQRDTKIGATNLVLPLVAGTDFHFTANADGTGADLDANFTVTASDKGSEV